ncbi:MAG: histidine ammonia-lyase [Pseudomonadota bacterium]
MLVIDGGALSLAEMKEFLEGGVRVAVSSKAMARVKRARAFVEKKLASREPFYGINTGFGMLADRPIPPADLEKLQENLILSHAVGVGNPFSLPMARLIMLLRANVLAMGYSGVREETLKLLVNMMNRGVVPIIPEQGSVGASGDLAPLAHIALAMIGRGDVFHKGRVVAAKRALKAEGLKPIRLSAKEGLALTNGTQAMAAMGAAALVRLENLIKVADIAGALSIEGDRASRRPFDARIHKLRPHPGQIATAANVRRLIVASGIIASHANCKRVQDPYSFRCIPQVHGAVKDALAYSRSVIMRETGSCTDNPIIFAEDDEIISGGNFHGEPLAFALDMIAIATSELGSISERRVAIMTAPLSGELKTRFLVPNPGLNSGLMIAHVTMSALVSENRALAHPASVDSIPTSGGQEDHVSMGPIAGRKALAIIRNVETIIAIEVLAACQAIDLQHQYGRPGRGTAGVYKLVRQCVPFIEGDREYRHDIAHCEELVRSGELVAAAEDACGTLAV